MLMHPKQVFKNLMFFKCKLADNFKVLELYLF